MCLTCWTWWPPLAGHYRPSHAPLLKTCFDKCLDGLCSVWSPDWQDTHSHSLLQVFCFTKSKALRKFAKIFCQSQKAICLFISEFLDGIWGQDTYTLTDLNRNQTFCWSTKSAVTYHIPPSISHCLLRVWKYSWYCIADYKQTCLFSCFRANRRAMAGSEWPEGSLLFWVERWDSCDIHQMAAQTSHLHEWSRGLCCYEGAGITMQSLCRNAS